MLLCNAKCISKTQVFEDQMGSATFMTINTHIKLNGQKFVISQSLGLENQNAWPYKSNAKGVSPGITLLFCLPVKASYFGLHKLNPFHHEAILIINSETGIRILQYSYPRL